MMSSTFSSSSSDEIIQSYNKQVEAEKQQKKTKKKELRNIKSFSDSFDSSMSAGSNNVPILSDTDFTDEDSNTSISLFNDNLKREKMSNLLSE